MTTFVASKFDPITDPDKPRIGEIIKVKGNPYQIMAYAWCPSSKMMEHMLNKTVDVLMDCKEYDECFSKEHSTRPGVQWLVYVKKL